MTPPERFAEVMDRLSARVYTLARYSLSSASDAEDVVQEVFTRLWESWDRMEVERVEGWLIRVTSNACTDARRRKVSRRKAEATLSLMGGPRGGDEASAGAEANELRDRVRAAIARLDDPYRTLLILREIEGLSYEELGAAMALSPAQVKVYLHRARARLTELLAPLRDLASPASRTEGAAHVR